MSMIKRIAIVVILFLAVYLVISLASARIRGIEENPRAWENRKINVKK